MGQHKEKLPSKKKAHNIFYPYIITNIYIFPF